MIFQVGAVLNSALYIAGVLAAALCWGNRLAALLAVATAGITYLSYVIGVSEARQDVKDGVVILSIGVGFIAGLALIFR